MCLGLALLKLSAESTQLIEFCGCQKLPSEKLPQGFGDDLDNYHKRREQEEVVVKEMFVGRWRLDVVKGELIRSVQIEPVGKPLKRRV